MITLITGASGSGKSFFAEQYVQKQQKKEQFLFYIATMKPYGEETKKKIERHREQREGKGFITIECYESLEEIRIEKKDSIVLLECLSNLLANEMYAEDGRRIDGGILEKIEYGIETLESQCSHLFVVTNEIFSAVPPKWEDSILYIRNLGILNQRLAKKAEEVYEVIAGIPMERKHSKCKDNIMEEKKENSRRILVLGGAFQGKTRWIREHWNQEEIIYGNNIIKQAYQNGECEVDKIWAKIEKMWKNGNDPILIVDEIGYGLVPMEKEEREYRELTGRITCKLAKQADEVYRVIAGIPQRLK